MRTFLTVGNRPLIRIFVSVAALLLLASPVCAVVRTYTINQAESSLTASGHLYGETYQAQGSGSLLASYSGSISLDVTPGQIQFIGSSVQAINSGSWTPQAGLSGGTQPAVYGAFTKDFQQGYNVTFSLATRNLVLNLTSSARPVSMGEFSVGGINLGFSQGVTDWTMTLDDFGGAPYLNSSSSLTIEAPEPLASGTATLANYSAPGSVISKLTIPLNVSVPINGDGVNSDDSLFILTGTLVAELRTASYGDFDGDGDVDGADFITWQTNYPISAPNTPGDADNDGDVDGGDFDVWRSNFPSAAAPGSTPVPEAASIGLSLSAFVGVVVAASRNRRYASRTAARGR